LCRSRERIWNAVEADAEQLTQLTPLLVLLANMFQLDDPSNIAWLSVYWHIPKSIALKQRLLQTLRTVHNMVHRKV
jgi:hypothetical protein